MSYFCIIFSTKHGCLICLITCCLTPKYKKMTKRRQNLGLWWPFVPAGRSLWRKLAHVTRFSPSTGFSGRQSPSPLPQPFSPSLSPPTQSPSPRSSPTVSQGPAPFTTVTIIMVTTTTANITTVPNLQNQQGHHLFEHRHTINFSVTFTTVSAPLVPQHQNVGPVLGFCHNFRKCGLWPCYSFSWA